MRDHLGDDAVPGVHREQLGLPDVGVHLVAVGLDRQVEPALGQRVWKTPYPRAGI